MSFVYNIRQVHFGTAAVPGYIVVNSLQDTVKGEFVLELIRLALKIRRKDLDFESKYSRNLSDLVEICFHIMI